jgi:hypothetical protein
MKRPSWISRVAMRSDADLGSLQKACAPASCAYNDSNANLLAVGQTVGQPTRTVRDMSDLAHAPDATVTAVHGRGSALTRKASLVQIQHRLPASQPGQSQIPGSQTVPGAGPETVAYRTAYLNRRHLTREEGVHRARTAGEHRPQLLAGHQLGDAAAGVANQVGDVLDTHPGAR